MLLSKSFQSWKTLNSKQNIVNALKCLNMTVVCPISLIALEKILNKLINQSHDFSVLSFNDPFRDEGNFTPPTAHNKQWRKIMIKKLSSMRWLETVNRCLCRTRRLNMQLMRLCKLKIQLLVLKQKVNLQNWFTLHRPIAFSQLSFLQDNKLYNETLENNANLRYKMDAEN